jgi:hypothetical protein
VYFSTRSQILLLILFLTLSTAAETSSQVAGSVYNKTLSRPAGDDVVILFRMGENHSEVAPGKTDARGLFSFAERDPGQFVLDRQPSMHLPRAIAAIKFRWPIT